MSRGKHGQDWAYVSFLPLTGYDLWKPLNLTVSTVNWVLTGLLGLRIK